MPAGTAADSSLAWLAWLPLRSLLGRVDLVARARGLAEEGVGDVRAAGEVAARVEPGSERSAAGLAAPCSAAALGVGRRQAERDLDHLDGLERRAGSAGDRAAGVRGYALG